MRKKKLVLLSCVWIVVSAATAIIFEKKAEKTLYTAVSMEPIIPRRRGRYEKIIKRGFDIFCASAAITIFSPLYLGTALMVRVKLGSPVLFTQDRPGLIGDDGRERIFKMYKFRSMTDEKDEDGKLLPDQIRLTPFGKKLRSTSLDELPEAFNILNGTMSVIGPRPQLVRDMVFMSKEQRQRHTSRPGLSGLAQIKGRNSITWEDKLNWDIEYIKEISFLNDLKLVWISFKQVFIRNHMLHDTEDTELTLDFGDALLRDGKVSKEEYDELQLKAKQILDSR